MLKISILIASVFLLTSCGGDELPLDHVYVVDVVHNVCSKKKIIDKENLVFQHVEDLPLYSCDGFIAVSYEDFGPLKNWIKRMIKKIKDCASSSFEGVSY